MPPSADPTAHGAGSDTRTLAIVRPAGDRPSAGWPAVMLLGGDGAAGDACLREQADWLASLGLAVAAPALAGGDARSDREALSALEAAAGELARLPELDAERLAVVGFGTGGTLALLFGCRSTRAAAVALVHGPIVYPALDARRPIQPLELALNLGSPVLALFGEADPELPLAHVDRMETVLSQFAVSFDIVRYPGVGARFYDPAGPGHDAAAAEDARRRLTAFLQTTLEME
jgi:carboxymethylenebutenolidase